MSLKTKDFFLKETHTGAHTPSVFRLPTLPPSFVRELGWKKHTALQFALDTKKGVVLIRAMEI